MLMSFGPSTWHWCCPSFFSGNVKLFLSLIFLFVLDIYTLLQHKLLLLAAAGMQTSLGSQLGVWSAAGPLWAATNVSKKSYSRCYVDAIWVCSWRRLALTSYVNFLVMCIFLLKFHYLFDLCPYRITSCSRPVHDHALVSSSIHPSIAFSLFIVFVSVRHKISAPPNNLLTLSTSPAPLRTSKRGES